MELKDYKTTEQARSDSGTYGGVESIYSPEMKDKLGIIQQRLESAKQLRESEHPYFGGVTKTYLQYFEANEKIANTYVPAKKNDDDVMISAGTIEQKLDSLLSHVYNLNLSPDVYAFDDNNIQHTALAAAVEDIIYDTEIQDNADGAGDEEKKMLRQRELLKQGTVFVQEEWVDRYEMKKRLKGEYNGEFKSFTGYDESLELVFSGPSRTVLYGPNVFLGDITKFYMQDQPFVFTLVKMSYDTAKGRYANFENFKFVNPGSLPQSNNLGQQTIFDNNWRLTELEANQVEVLMYQDAPNDEFQIIINGVCMLPIGFPLSAVSPRGGYNIAKQVYRVLSDKFAYGGSFCASGSVQQLSNLIDEMLKLMVLKTRKSFTPAYVNTSGRVIDRKVLSPGRISMGIDPDSLKAIAGGENQGVTSGETAVLRTMQDLVDKSTVSDQFTGQQGPAGTTATEVSVMQQQARLTLGLTVAACMLLEKKLAYLRLWNILEHYFEPTGETVVTDEDGKPKMANTYRTVSRRGANIKGAGKGQRSVVITDGERPTSRQIKKEELEMEAITNSPYRKLYVNRNDLKDAKLTWYMVINAKERESSPFYKNEFRTLLNDITGMVQFGSVPNKETLEEEFAKVHGKSKSSYFSAPQGQLPGGTPSPMGMGGAMQGMANTAGMPSSNGQEVQPSMPSFPEM